MDYMNTDLGSDTNSEESIQVQSEEPKDMNLINTKTVQLEPTQLEPSQLEPIRTTSTKASDETPANILSSLSRFQSQNNYAEADITETPTEYKESYSQESYSQQTHNTKLDELMSLMTTLLSQATILHEKIQEEKEKTGTLSVTQKKEEKELLELKLKLFC